MLSHDDKLPSTKGNLEEDHLLEKDDPQIPLPKPALRHRIYVWIPEATFFIVSLLILITGIRTHGIRTERCVEKLSTYSPALEVVQDTPQIVRFDGSFAKPNAFKGPPSPSRDAAWDGITYADGMMTSYFHLRITHDIQF